MSSRGDRLFVYVTSHGFGHMNRTVAVVNRVPSAIPVTIRCHRNLFQGWRERLERPAELEHHISDSGAVNPPGDSAATDGRATVELAARVHAEAMARVDEEVERLRSGSAAAVLSDVPPVPLVAAARAGVPGYALANFTWAEIYAEHAEEIGPEALQLVAELRHCYSQATALLQARPCLAMTEFEQRIDVGMVVTPGRRRRAELCERLGVDPREKLAYFYVGRYGQADLGWERLEQHRGVHFVGFHEAPQGKLANLHVVPPEEWTGSDLAASCDATVAKAGYGTVCEAMAAGTPLIYPPRDGFAEHGVLEEAMAAWGGGLRVPPERFAALDIGAELERAFALRLGPAPYPADGAERAAGELARVCLARR